MRVDPAERIKAYTIRESKIKKDYIYIALCQPFQAFYEGIANLHNKVGLLGLLQHPLDKVGVELVILYKQNLTVLSPIYK